MLFQAGEFAYLPKESKDISYGTSKLPPGARDHPALILQVSKDEDHALVAIVGSPVSIFKDKADTIVADCIWNSPWRRPGPASEEVWKPRKKSSISHQCASSNSSLL